MSSLEPFQPQNRLAFRAFSENVRFSEFPSVPQYSETLFYFVFKDQPFFVFSSAFFNIFGKHTVKRKEENGKSHDNEGVINSAVNAS